MSKRLLFFLALGIAGVAFVSILSQFYAGALATRALVFF